MIPLHVLDLGIADYSETLALQRRGAEFRISGQLPHDLLILCEHPPVVTLGRARSSASNLLMSAEALRERGAELHEVERGGDVTFHGPGQLVGYAIVDLKAHRKDLHWFLRQLEEVLIGATAQLGVPAERVSGLTGVWVKGRKLASIGVHARDWVTWHGFALNVHTDLSWFETIVPCGIADVTMTSLASELEIEIQTNFRIERDLIAILMGQTKAAVIDSMAAAFGLLAEPLPAELLVQLKG